MRDETMLCIGPRRWDGLWKETQAIMCRLAPANRVLYVEPGRDPERGVLAEMRRNVPNLFGLTIREVRQNLLVVSSPPVLPHARQHLPSSVLRMTIPLITRINTGLITMHVRRAMRALGITSPVLWLTDPYHASLVGRFHEKVACYLNFDEFAEMVENRRVSGLLRRLDDQLTRRADVVFTTSRAQCRRRQVVNARTHFLPNAVDYDLFARAVTEELPIPADIGQVPRPILGFVGWLTNHIDVALLRRLAEVYVQGSLVLVGPDQLPASADLECATVSTQRSVRRAEGACGGPRLLADVRRGADAVPADRARAVRVSCQTSRVPRGRTRHRGDGPSRACAIPRGRAACPE